MKIRFEKRKTFYVSGYPMETSEARLEKDCATLREKYEHKLRSISDHLYFASWMAKEGIISAKRILYLLCAFRSRLRRNRERCAIIPYRRYGIIASPMTEGGVMTYLLGVEATSKTSATEGATCIEVPATCFAIATVPEGAPILATWYEFFEKGIPSLGATIDMDYNFYFESFDESGVCELWISVVLSE